jgi:SM-20-related protein
MPEPRIGRVQIEGRDLFICDNLIDPAMANAIGAAVKRMHFIRKEKSRPDVPGLVAVADIDAALLTKDPFFLRLRAIAEKMLPGEVLRDMRAYVNCAVYGDSYFTHRDCPPERNDVTVLYYANLAWQADWGGETLFYNDENDAVLAVSPRPGRLVVGRGSILHRANVPTRSCYEERFTIAYKMFSDGLPAVPA